MAVKVEIDQELKETIFKKFKKESKIIFNLIKTLEEFPNKGKLLGNVGGIAIKELKYKSFRFYFILEGNKLRFLNQNKLVDLLIRFIRMSNKKDQQKTINEIRNFLLKNNFTELE
jgi:hypothetical protein